MDKEAHAELTHHPRKRKTGLDIAKARPSNGIWFERGFDPDKDADELVTELAAKFRRSIGLKQEG